MIRLAVVGSHGVGKSALCRVLAEELGLPLIHEQVRLVARDMGYTPSTIPEDLIFQFQAQSLIQHAELEEDYHDLGFVADRSVVDYRAYLNSIPTSIKEKYSFEYRVTKRVEEHRIPSRVPYYTHIVFIPIMFELENDGERHIDLQYQLNIEDFFRMEGLRTLTRGTSANLLMIDVDGLEKRKEKVLRWLGK